jgi:metal-responsive CopG/Arc/MetJ family transcriptional regulator
VVCSKKNPPVCQFIATVDSCAIRQEDKPSRSEAIRRLVELGLKAKK